MTRAVTTHRIQDSTREAILYLSLELGKARWKLGFSTGRAKRPRERMIEGGDVEALEREIGLALQKFRLPPETQVISCYEAGRDGFWLHRFLEAIGVTNYVVDSSSLEVKRRARRMKTDRMDMGGLLRLLIRFVDGEREVWSVVNVPSPEAEDARHVHRELLALKRDRGRVTTRIRSLLATQGLSVEVSQGFETRLDQVRLWDELPVPTQLAERLKREWRRREWLSEQIRDVESERMRLLRTSHDPAVEKVRQLYMLRAIGINSAWLFVMEFFAWRAFTNRRQVGALSGLTPTPYQSGDSRQELGISKAGNAYVRWMAIEIAWAWLRYQPQSALSIWYRKRFANGGARMRRIGIVALARRLLVELWRYLETGALPEGALTKS